MIESRFIDFVIGIFGRGRAKLGEWPHREVVQAAVETIQNCGGELHHESGTPAGELEVMHFRICGHRMKLCIEDYGVVSLWGPKRLVADIAKRVEQRLSETGPRKLLNSVPKDRAALLESWGWHNPNAAIAHSLRAELKREVPPGHLLYQRPVDVVAYREDQDDVLCRHQDDPDRFTVIHLTWSCKKEVYVDHPSVCFDGKFEAFFIEEQTFYERRTL